MSDIDVVEKIISDQPDLPVHIPYAGNTSPGIASFNSRDFIVEENGAVQLSKDVQNLTERAEQSASQAAISASNAQAAAASAARSADVAASNAQAAAAWASTAEQNAEQSAQSALQAETAEESAALSAANAQKHLEDVNAAKNQVSNYKDEVEIAVTHVQNMSLEIAQDVTNAENSASAAASSASAAAQSAGQSAQSALQAQEYAQQAQEYAQKHYEIVASYDALPQPGNSAYIYLVPSSTASGANNYEEYLWITNTSSYEFIGMTSDVDLSNYAQVNGTYSGMTVGYASQAENASQLGGVDADQYAVKNGTFPMMSVGYASSSGTMSAESTMASSDQTETFYKIIKVPFEENYYVNDVIAICGVLTQNGINQYPVVTQSGYTKNNNFAVVQITCTAGTTGWDVINIKTIAGDMPNGFILYNVSASNNDISIVLKTNKAYINVYKLFEGGTLHSSILSPFTVFNDTENLSPVIPELPFLSDSQNMYPTTSVQTWIPGAKYVIDYGYYMEEQGPVGPSAGDYIIDPAGHVFMALQEYTPLAGEIEVYATGKIFPFFVKPKKGIDRFQLSSDVISSLNKADSALQEAPVVPNGTYSGMSVGYASQAENAATATDSEKLGGVLATNYAINTGTYSGMTVGNATNASQLGGVLAEDYALLADLAQNYTGFTLAPECTNANVIVTIEEKMVTVFFSYIENNSNHTGNTIMNLPQSAESFTSNVYIPSDNVVLSGVMGSGAKTFRVNAYNYNGKLVCGYFRYTAK